MDYSYSRKHTNRKTSTVKENDSVKTGVQDPAYQGYLQAVLAGRAKADSDTMDHRQDLVLSLTTKRKSHLYI